MTCLARHGCDTSAELPHTSVKQLVRPNNSLRNKSLVVYWSVYEINLRLFGNNANIYIEKVYSELFHGSARVIIRSLERGLARAVGSESDR